MWNHRRHGVCYSGDERWLPYQIASAISATIFGQAEFFQCDGRRQEITALTSTHVLSETVHHLMTLEAVGRAQAVATNNVVDVGV
jgi:hypothetical protein